MLRFIARFLGFWLVAGAVVFAVVDGAKSIAASGLVTTSVAETWAIASGAGEIAAGAAPPLPPIEAPWPLDLALAWLMAAPAVLVLAVAGVGMLVLGAKKRRPFLSREFAA